MIKIMGNGIEEAFNPIKFSVDVREGDLMRCDITLDGLCDWKRYMDKSWDIDMETSSGIMKLKDCHLRSYHWDGNVTYLEFIVLKSEIHPIQTQISDKVEVVELKSEI